MAFYFNDSSTKCHQCYRFVVLFASFFCLHSVKLFAPAERLFQEIYMLNLHELYNLYYMFFKKCNGVDTKGVFRTLSNI